MELLVFGNGASRTGAPRSLLTLLQQRPPGLKVRLALIGSGPLLPEYHRSVDDVAVVAAPRSFGPTGYRLLEEAWIARSVMAIAGKWGTRAARIIVNTIDYEMPLACAALGRATARVIIREQGSYLDGSRGWARRRLLRLVPPDGIRCVSSSHAETISFRLGYRVEHLPNVVVRSRPRCPWAPRPTTFLAVGAGRQKGLEFALEAFQQMTQREHAQLIVVAPQRPAATEGVLWFQEIEDLGDRIEEYADVVLGVSSGEPFGRVPVEAALAGVPTLAWDVPGYRETVPILGGSLIAPFDVTALAKEMDERVTRTEPQEMPTLRAKTASEMYGQDAISKWWEWLVG